MDASSTSPPAPFTSGVDAGSPSVPFSGAPSPDDLGRSKSRMKNLKTAEAFLNKFLSSKSQHDQQFRNSPYPNHLSLLTEEHLAAEHLPRFLSHCGLWLSDNKFQTRQKPYVLSVKVKSEYFKSWKMILKKKFPLHPMLKEGSNQD